MRMRQRGNSVEYGVAQVAPSLSETPQPLSLLVTRLLMAMRRGSPNMLDMRTRCPQRKKQNAPLWQTTHWTRGVCHTLNCRLSRVANGWQRGRIHD